MFFTNKNNNQSVKSTSQQTKSIQMAMANIEITWIDYICVIQQQRQLPGCSTMEFTFFLFTKF